MKFRRAPWLFACLAVLLNLGSPMAWTQPAQPEPAECHGQTMPAADEAASTDSMPCCEEGSCHCVAPALSVAATLVPGSLPNPVFIAPADTSALPAHPFDDDLRPPIR